MSYSPRLPWKARHDPDGPSEILNSYGQVVAQVNTREATELFLAAPAMLGQLRKLHKMMVSVNPEVAMSPDVITLAFEDVLELEKVIDELGYREPPLVCEMRKLVELCERFKLDVTAAKKALKDAEGGWM